MIRVVVRFDPDGLAKRGDRIFQFSLFLQSVTKEGMIEVVVWIDPDGLAVRSDRIIQFSGFSERVQGRGGRVIGVVVWVDADGLAVRGDRIIQLSLFFQRVSRGGVILKASSGLIRMASRYAAIASSSFPCFFRARPI